MLLIHVKEDGWTAGRAAPRDFPRANPEEILCGVWPKASLFCGTQVTRVRIVGGVV